MRKLLLTVVGCFVYFLTVAQNIDDLNLQLTQKENNLANSITHLDSLTKQVATLEQEVAELQDQITPYPRWHKGVFGNLGFNLSNYSDWLAKETPNIQSANIGFAFNAFINLDQQKFYWKNVGLLNLGWIKVEDADSQEDNQGFQVASDAFQFTSTLGYKISEKLALSSLTEYRTSLLDGRFNNPGYLDIGSLGLTWTPSPNLSFSFHSLSYNFILSEDGANFASSFGAKIGGDYVQQLPIGIAWKSNLSAFLSYKNINDLSNWIWTNSFTTAIKGIGVGLTVGLKGSKQEAVALGIKDNPLQSFWLLGLTYNL